MNYDYRTELFNLGIKLNNTGRSTCPECSSHRSNSKDKCLSVTYGDDSVKYNCHHCDFKGVIPYSKNSFAITKTKKVYQKPKANKKLTSQESLYKYFKEKRGISQNTVDDYGVYIDDNKNIIFPYFKNGELINNKARFIIKDTGKKGFTQTKDSEQALFGMDLIPNDCKSLIWVEGEFDVMSFYEVGKFAVSPNQGGNDKKLECFENCYDFINSFDEHIIAVDNDEVGNVLKENLKSRLKNKLVKIVDWNKYESPNKDANDFVARGDKGVLIDALELAEEIKHDGIEKFSDKKDYLLDVFDGNIDIPLTTGWQNLDKLMRLQTGRLMIVSGISKLGKSFFVDNLIYNTIKIHKWNHFVCSFEGSMSDHMNCFAEFETEKSARLGYKDRMTREEYSKSIDIYSEYITRLRTDKMYTVDEILEVAEYVVSRFGVKTITIDPYNKLKHPTSEREDKYVDEILSKMLNFAKKRNVLVIFIAHPKKNIIGRPNLGNISGSVAWESMADYGIIVHRERLDEDKLSTVSEIFVEKVKSTTLGDPAGGTVYLEYNYPTKKLITTEKPIGEKRW